MGEFQIAGMSAMTLALLGATAYFVVKKAPGFK
jgi:hypothetical protein